MNSLTKSCSSTIVIIANGEVQTHEKAAVYVKELDIFLTVKVLENTSAVLSLDKLYDENGYGYEWINDQKPHLIKNGMTLRTSFLSWFQTCQRVRPPVLIIQLETLIQDKRGLLLHLPQTRPLHQRRHQVIERLEKEKIELKVIPLQCLCQVSIFMIERRNPLFVDSGRASSEIPEWLQEFREILKDDENPERKNKNVSSSHEVFLESASKRREDLIKLNVFVHFPKFRNYEICQRTKFTTVPCRRRNDGAVPRAEIFVDLIAADHKVLSESCESRNNHRLAVVM